MKKKSILFLMAIGSTFAIHAQTADEIVSNFFKNSGGLENWRKLNSIKMEGKLAMRGMGEMPVTILLKRPAMTKVIINFQGPEFIQAYDGTIGWRINPMLGSADPIKLSGDEIKEYSNQKFENDFVDYQIKGHSITLLGEEIVDGINCYKIQMIKNKNNDQEESVEVTFFEKEKFLPRMKSARAQSGPDKGMEVNTHMTNYKEVDGYLIPTIIEDMINNQSIRKITVEKMQLNVTIDDDAFTFPKK
jgi:outer membrane lipoprotein-sorting protein